MVGREFWPWFTRLLIAPACFVFGSIWSARDDRWIEAAIGGAFALCFLAIAAYWLWMYRRYGKTSGQSRALD
jgi:hypothetical protein